MCGIVGAVGMNLDFVSLDKSVELLQHRGPDANGKWRSSNCWLGHTRLSILDLNERSNQPFTDYVDDCVLAFNGEIYNFIELKNTLLKDGISFRTNSDTEVILHSWRKWGNECFGKFKGMFALAIWNPTKNELTLARDRFGEKPLYYTKAANNQFFFSSELRTTIHISNQNQICLSGLNDFLFFNYIASPNSLIKGIKKLNPGSYATWSKSKFQEFKYWTLPSPSSSIPPQESQTEIRDKLVNSIQNTLKSDVPLGLCLSGGVDSSAIAALAKKELNFSLDCISVGYEGYPDCDESLAAKATSDMFGHTFHRVKLGNDDILEVFPKMVEAIDEPVSDISSISYFSIYQKSKSLGLKVMLGGIGADEIFNGYEFHNRNILNSEERQNKQELEIQRSGSDHGWDNQILWVEKPFPANQVPNFFRNTIAHSINPQRLPSRSLTKSDNESWFEAMRRMLVSHWLEGNCLSLIDKLSMRFSIESRSPYLYTDISEYALKLCPKSSLSSNNAKISLKHALKDDLDMNLLNQTKKGFTPPTKIWKELLVGKYRHVLDKSNLGQIIAIKEITNIHLLYNLIFLAIWLESLSIESKLRYEA